jgi:flavin-dependent dehydrogenase
MMGEGIAYAMQSSKIAVDVIDQAIAENQYDADSLWKYHHLCRKEFLANFQMASWMGSRGISFASNLLPRMSDHKLASDIMAMVARGEIGYADIPYIILKKIPRQIPSFIKHVLQSYIQTRN